MIKSVNDEHMVRTHGPLDGAADLVLGFKFGGYRGTGLGGVLWHTSFRDGFSERHRDIK